MLHPVLLMVTHNHYLCCYHVARKVIFKKLAMVVYRFQVAIVLELCLKQAQSEWLIRTCLVHFRGHSLPVVTDMHCRSNAKKWSNNREIVWHVELSRIARYLVSFKLCMGKEKERLTKSKLWHLVFSTMRMVSRAYEVDFTIAIGFRL